MNSLEINEVDERLIEAIPETKELIKKNQKILKWLLNNGKLNIEAHDRVHELFFDNKNSKFAR